LGKTLEFPDKIWAKLSSNTNLDQKAKRISKLFLPLDENTIFFKHCKTLRGAVPSGVQFRVIKAYFLQFVPHEGSISVLPG